MNFEMRRVMIVVAVVISVIGIWWAWQSRGKEIYGGIRPFMDKMYSLQQGTGAKVREAGALPEDFTPMEQLSQTVQDIFAVFRNDPRVNDPKFKDIAKQLMQRGSALEHAWDHGTPVDARKAYDELVTTCNTCHQTIGGGPSITP